MEVIILSAGLGTRLMPFTKETPKPLVKVLGCPIIEYNLNYLSQKGFSKAFINRYKFVDKFEKIKKPDSLKLNFSIEKNILGTLGGLLSFQEQIQKDNFFVINGDIFFDFNLKFAYEKHIKENSLLTMVLKEKREENVSSVFINKNNKVVKIGGKKDKGKEYIYTGISIVNKDIFKYAKSYKNKFSCLVKDFIIPFLDQEKISSYVLSKEDLWFETGNIDQYTNVNMDFLKILLKDDFYALNIKKTLKNNGFYEHKENIFSKNKTNIKMLAPVVIDKNIDNCSLKKIGPFVYISEQGNLDNRKILENEIIL